MGLLCLAPAAFAAPDCVASAEVPGTRVAAAGCLPDRIRTHKQGNMFSTQSHAENLALLRAVIEAKFHSQPNDTDVPGSAILARLAERLRDVVVAEEVRREGTTAAKRWQRWAAITPSRPEWSAALQFAAESWRDVWNNWSGDERIAAATWLMSPYEPEPTQLDVFLKAVAGALATGRE